MTPPKPTLQQVLDFLYGASDLDGVWFGGKHPTLRGTFWWRPVLREAIESAQAQPMPEQARARAVQLCDWIAESPHQRGSINGLAAQVRHELTDTAGVTPTDGAKPALTDKEILHAFSRPVEALHIINMLKDEVIVGDFQRAVVAGVRSVLAAAGVQEVRDGQQ